MTTVNRLPSTATDIYGMTVTRRLKVAPDEDLVKSNGNSLAVIFYRLSDNFRIIQTEITYCLFVIRTYVYSSDVLVTTLYTLTSKVNMASRYG